VPGVVQDVTLIHQGGGIHMAHGEYTHIEIPADDSARAQRFYEGLFGWTFTSMPGFDDYFLYTTAAGEEGVGGAIGKRGASAPSAIRTYIAVDSIDETSARIAGLGGRVVEEKLEVPGQGWYSVLADSEGNEIALWERAPR
jgi:predicted enzyme related to lactoylglutathione lyase